MATGPFLALQNGDSLRLEPAGSNALLRYGDAQSLLASFEGWWDTNNYVSGTTWANQGSAGSAINASVSAINPPAFTGGVFVFDGVNDTITVATNAAIGPGANQSFSFGCIMQPIVTLLNGTRVMAKDPGSGQQYCLRGGTGNVLRATVNDGTTAARADATPPPVGSWSMVSAVRDVPNLKLTTYLNGTAGTPLTLTSTAAVSNTSSLTFGSGSGNFCNMSLKAAWFTKTALTQAQISTIAAYYGL